MTYALETQIENLRAEVNRLNNVIGERDWEIQKLKEERDTYQAAMIAADNECLRLALEPKEGAQDE